METLRDPLKDRQVSEVPLPFTTPLPESKLRDALDNFDYKIISKYLSREGHLSKSSVM